MNLKIVILIIILFLAIFIFLNRKKIDKYLKPIGRIGLGVILFIIIVICFLAIGTSIYRNSIGNLFTDYADTKNSPTQSGSGDTFIITITLDQIIVNDTTFPSSLEAQPVITEAVKSGKAIRIIDDYALASTYNDVIDMILKMNVNRSSIEEIRQP